MPRISIITINYNDKVGLEKTILSVINQAFDDFEYIIIDGGSTDGSKDIIEKYQDKISYWVSEKDKGIYNAMNKGIVASRGEYLLFMNSGDVLIDDCNILEKSSEFLKEDILAFDCFLIKNNQIVGRRTHIHQPTLFYVYKYGFKHQSTFIKRALFLNLGLYNESYKIAGDYEFWIRCFLKPDTTSKSYQLPISIFELSGISQQNMWWVEHQRIYKELLPHLIEDFNALDELLRYKKSRILNKVVYVYDWIIKVCSFIKNSK